MYAARCSGSRPIGLAMNAVQFSLMFVAFDRGRPPSGLAPPRAQPRPDRPAGGRAPRERVTGSRSAASCRRRRGPARARPDVEDAGGPVAVALGVTAMLTLSLGTLGQRWIGEQPDLLWSAVGSSPCPRPRCSLAGPPRAPGPWSTLAGGRGRVPGGGQLHPRPGPAGSARRRAGSGAAAACSSSAAGDGGARVAGARRDAAPTAARRPGRRGGRRRCRHPDPAYAGAGPQPGLSRILRTRSAPSSAASPRARPPARRRRPRLRGPSRRCRRRR